MVTRRDGEAKTGSVRKCSQGRGYTAMFYSLITMDLSGIVLV